MCENSKYYTISHSVKYFLSSINTKCSNELSDMRCLYDHVFQRKKW